MLVCTAAAGLVGAGCSNLPSKKDAFEVLTHEVKEEALCTLPVGLLSRLKMQYTTKAVCVPREGPSSDPAMSCVDALVAAGVTKPMPASYMNEWPDDIALVVSVYERRARHLLFKSCVEMVGDLRSGGFRCGEARADHIIQISKKADKQALVRYARVITLDPGLAAIDAACGVASRPPPEETVTLEKSESRWIVVAEGEATSP